MLVEDPRPTAKEAAATVSAAMVAGQATALADYGQGELMQPLSVEALGDRIDRVHKVMRERMKLGVHYGKTPGTPKPSLWKPGGELLLAMFQLYPKPIVEDLSYPPRGEGTPPGGLVEPYDDHITYRIRTELRAMGTDHLIGIGLGTCSSREEKYSYRRAVCEAEYDAAEATRRRIKWRYGRRRGDPPYQERQIRVPPADVENTVLKMAAKRSLIGGVLVAVGASDIFTQGIEDLPQGMEPDVEARARPKPKQEVRRKSAPAEPETDDTAVITEPQRRGLRAAWQKASKTEPEVKAYLGSQYGIESTKQILVSDYAAILDWAKDPDTTGDYAGGDDV